MATAKRGFARTSNSTHRQGPVQLDSFAFGVGVEHLLAHLLEFRARFFGALVGLGELGAYQTLEGGVGLDVLAQGSAVALQQFPIGRLGHVSWEREREPWRGRFVSEIFL